MIFQTPPKSVSFSILLISIFFYRRLSKAPQICQFLKSVDKYLFIYDCPEFPQICQFFNPIEKYFFTDVVESSPNLSNSQELWRGYTRRKAKWRTGPWIQFWNTNLLIATKLLSLLTIKKGGSYVPAAQESPCHFSQDCARVLTLLDFFRNDVGPRVKESFWAYLEWLS